MATAALILGGALIGCGGGGGGGAGGGSTAGGGTTLARNAELVYVANGGDNTVSQFRVNWDATLTPLSPAAVPAGAQPAGITATAGFVYVANRSDNTVSQFRIAPDGQLVPLSPAAVPVGRAPQAIVAEPSGNPPPNALSVFVVNSGDDTVSQFVVGAGGALHPLSPATLPTGHRPAAIALDCAGTGVYVVNSGDDTVSQYTMRGDGSLSTLGPAVPTGHGPSGIVVGTGSGVTPDAAYVANRDDNTLTLLQVNADNTLTPLPVAVTVPAPTAVLNHFSALFGPYRDYVAVASPAGLYTFGLVPAGNTLGPVSPPTLAAGNSPVAFATDNLYNVYAVNAGENTISEYRSGSGGKIGSTVNPLTPAGTAATGRAPAAVVLTTPTGVF